MDEVDVDEENEENLANEEARVDENDLQSEAFKSELKTSYKLLLETLNAAYPKTIDQVKLFVHEMRRITLLREELWLGT